MDLNRALLINDLALKVPWGTPLICVTNCAHYKLGVITIMIEGNYWKEKERDRIVYSYLRTRL